MNVPVYVLKRFPNNSLEKPSYDDDEHLFTNESAVVFEIAFENNTFHAVYHFISTLLTKAAFSLSKNKFSDVILLLLYINVYERAL